MLTVNSIIYKNPLFVFALESEAGIEFNKENKIFVGVGKVNATYHLMKGIQRFQPDLIVNLGTAGSTKFNRGEVVCCTEFIQRDMDVAALGFKKFETPFSDDPVVLNYGITLDHLSQAICGTGDQFEMEHLNPEYNVIDMEGFALAKISKLENIPFLCLKYISDGADGNAVDDWKTEVKNAATQLSKALKP